MQPTVSKEKKTTISKNKTNKKPTENHIKSHKIITNGNYKKDSGL